MEKLKKWSNENQGVLALISLIVTFFLALFKAWTALIIFISLILFIAVVWLYNIVYRLIILSHRRFKIIKAEYGSGNTFVDITNQLNDLVIDNMLNVKLSNGILGYDPAPNVLKYVKIKYQLNKNFFNKKFIEGKMINLP